MNAPLKLKKCKCGCGERFMPWSPMQVAASPSCAQRIAEMKREKEAARQEQQERRETRARKEAIKRKGDYIKEAQSAFNEFIRLRDKLAGHPCISSGLPLDWTGNNVDAGHYRSRGAAPHLRFNELNCHAQSKKQNRWLAGNAADYRIGLVSRIGSEAVEGLETDNVERRYSKEELIEIRDYYREEVRRMKRS